MKILVAGSGGREHALALALSRDPAVEAVHVGPGNPGTWQLSWALGLESGTDLWRRLTGLDPLDGEAVAALARELGCDLVVIGPEAPLVAGVADQVRQAGIACFGPSREAAQLEGSKQFAKDVMTAAQVPTARSRYCRTPAEIEAALDEFGAPHVVKNDGLAAGKGVVVTTDRAEALAHGIDCGVCVVEEYLDGPEVSLFAICDGQRAVPLIPAQDFKRVGEADTGPNTGGMGAYTPLGWAPDGLVEATMERVIKPTLAEMARRGTPFQGLLYAGLALTSRGLRVVEFNVRFGDPETEAVLPLLASGLGQVLLAAAEGDLARLAGRAGIMTGGEEPRLIWDDGAALTVIAAAQGYPGTPVKGGRIGLPEPGDGVEVVHCGTGLDEAGHLVARGGRVLAVVARSQDLAGARRLAYDYLAQVDFPTGFHRPDIAAKAVAGQIETPASL